MKQTRNTDKPSFSPATATFNQLCRISRDNKEVKDFSILTDGVNVHLTEQRVGSRPMQMFTLPRSYFNKLIKWYLAAQVAVRK